MAYLINGIQQIGIGVRSKSEAWKWYRKYFSMDIPVFQEAAEAPLMTRYTGGKVCTRDAALALNLKGGSGFEIWQYTSRETAYPEREILLGDTGIGIVKIKAPDIHSTYEYFKSEDLKLLSGIHKDPLGQNHFYMNDPWGNCFEICEQRDYFLQNASLTGGPFGAVIGVKDISKVLPLYKALSYDKILFDSQVVHQDFQDLPGGHEAYRRVILSHTKDKTGPFSKVFGKSCIELVQAVDRQAEAVFRDRQWGDAGFIHLCFDISRMDDLQKTLADSGFPFTVDSKDSFDMGEAAGRFSYIEDPDGSLIEFVETHKVPLMKKFNLYLNLKRRAPDKALPDFMIKLLALGRIK